MSQRKHVDAPIECPFYEHCSFVHNNIDSMPSLVSRTLENYCTQRDNHCARRTVYDALGAENVPDLMLPDQHGWARQFVEDYEPDRESAKETAAKIDQ